MYMTLCKSFIFLFHNVCIVGLNHYDKQLTIRRTMLFEEFFDDTNHANNYKTLVVFYKGKQWCVQVFVHNDRA